MQSKMMNYILGFFCLIFTQNMYAQLQPNCSADEMRKSLIEKYPEILQREKASEEFAGIYSSLYYREGIATYVIPVVFHVIHNYGPENISDEQIFEAVDRMNEDFSKMNPDFDETVSEFLGIAADCQIEFRLAQRELSGTCTNGIDRIASMRTYTGGDAAKLGGWQHGFYLNIWVVDFLSGNAAAYAYYPSTIGDALAPIDGVICRYDYVGSTGEAGLYSAHTLSHEVGHYLNLQHTWGNTNEPAVECGDDQVSDTPETKGWLTCNLSGHTCIDPLDNVQNFMEYSYCSTMFTEGQKIRMQAALNSTDAARLNLWQESTHILTGIQDGYTAGLCAPVADFYAQNREICSGESVTFHDKSWKGDVDSRTWTFENGIPETSTIADPIVSFTTDGWHKVTLSVQNASGVSTKSIDQYVYSSPEPTLNGSYFESFNNKAEVENTWLLYNRYPDDFQWKWRESNGYFNTGCIWLNSRYGPNAEKDNAVSPAFDLSDGSAENLFFKYSTTSSATYAIDYTMELHLYYSTTCGKTWISLGVLTGEELISSYGGASNFFPNYPDQWRSATFNLPSGAKSENVKFKIEFEYNNYSNNVFIDDFNFTSGVLNTQNEFPQLSCNVLPNPTNQNNSVIVNYYLLNANNANMMISDITGRTLISIDLGNQSAGSNQFEFVPTDYNMSKGCYFITLSNNQSKVVQKLLIQ